MYYILTFYHEVKYLKKYLLSLFEDHLQSYCSNGNAVKQIIHQFFFSIIQVIFSNFANFLISSLQAEGLIRLSNSGR